MSSLCALLAQRLHIFSVELEEMEERVPIAVIFQHMCKEKCSDSTLVYHTVSEHCDFVFSKFHMTALLLSLVSPSGCFLSFCCVH